MIQWQTESDPVAPAGARIACSGCRDCARCRHVPLRCLVALQAKQITPTEWRDLMAEGQGLEP